jgi:anti-anti-sigma factor
MKNSLRSVSLHTLPSDMTHGQQRLFLTELQRKVQVERPRMVLDCSKIEVMDDATMHLLLCCLEEAMKSNGDLKLASISKSGVQALQANGISRLFEIYPTNAAAIESFQHYLGSGVRHSGDNDSALESGTAA